VAYVESVKKIGVGEYEVTITHMNWAAGDIVRVIQGCNVQKAVLRVYWKNCVPGTTRMCMFNGKSTEYVLSGFLSKP
jgi:hypothetical protein